MLVTPYTTLKLATDKYFADPTKLNETKTFKIAHSLLKKEGIQMRDSNKNLPIQFNLSFPKEEYIVFGIRYIKSGERPYRPGTESSEDHFLFEKGCSYIQTGDGKKKWLEKLLPQYKGTHKRSFWLDVIKNGEWARENPSKDFVADCFKIEQRS
jgi:hypothetical protein